jgi:Ca2+-binding EF-hand superfamily protein
MGASHSGIHVDLAAIEAPAEGTNTQDRKFGKQLGVKDEKSQLRFVEAESS